MRSRTAVFATGCCATALLLALTVGLAQTVATVQTDKADFRPGETALITGNGFGPQELVTLQVTHIEPVGDEAGAGHEPWTVTSDAQGHFETTWYVDPDDSVGATLLLTAVSATASAQTTFTDAAAATLEQCRNNDALAPNDCAELGGGTGWVNGNAGTQTSHYVEGYSIPYRTVMTQIPIGQSISIDLGYDVKHSGAHAVDFLTHFQRLESHAGFGHAAETVFPMSGISGVSATVNTFAIPTPSTAGSPVAGQPATRFLSLPGGQRVMTLYGGTITGITYVTNGSLTASQSETVIRVTFTPDSATAVLAWGGHIGRAVDWGEGNSAGGISGSPYHMRVKDWRCEDGVANSQCDRDLGNLGNQDRSLSADAVFPTGTVIITKQIAGDGANNTFNFSSTGLGANSFPLTTVDPNKNVSRTFTEVLANRPISVTELAPPTGWEFVDLVCQDPDGGTTTSNATRTATIDLDGNETVHCTFTNRENVTLTRGQIIVQKVTQPASDTTTLFEFSSDWAGAFSLHGGESHDSGFIAPGTYSVSESATLPTGWALTSATCTSSIGDTESSASIELDAGEVVTCTFTNTKTAHLQLVKTVTNDNGGSATANQWMLVADGLGANDHSGNGGFDRDVMADTYALSETAGPAGYSAGSWSCTGDGTFTAPASIALTAGQSAVCTINNNDQAAHLTLVKTATNDNGGTALATAWTLTAGGPTPLSGATGSAAVTNAAVSAGSYTLGETGGPTGYTAGTYSCVVNGGGAVSGNAVTLALGDSAVCTINNDDQPAHLTLVKTVTNDNGGTALATAWTLTAGGPTPLSGATGSAAVTNAVVSAGGYTLGETGGPTGYTAGTYSCVVNGGGAVSGNAVTLAPGDSAVCTINNNDKPAHLTLVKTVTNNDGGTAGPTDWTLTADGTGANDHSGAGGFEQDVNADTYALSESTGPAGYVAGTFSCVLNGGAPVPGNSVTLGLGDNAVCTINNDDQVTRLTLVKTVTNDNGGTALATAWTLTASGPTPIGGATGSAAVTSAIVSAGSYTLSETGGPTGYTAGTYSCVVNGGGAVSGNSVTLAAGDSAVCTINNDDQPAHLTLVKTVTNNSGGTAAADAWTLTAGGPTPLSGATGSAAVTNAVVSAGSYTLGETGGPTNYTAGTYSCVVNGGGAVSGNAVTLALGDSAVCTINNDDQPAHLTLVKTVTNNNGGTAAPGDWTLSASGPTPLSGTTGSAAVTNAVVSAGSYTLGETGGPTNYTAGTYSCVVNGGAPVSANTVTLALGDSAVCTINNDDKPAHLKLVKTVNNDNGGTALATAWTLVADGTGANDHSGAGGFDLDVNADTYALSESAGPAGYTAGAFSCVVNGGAAASGASVTLAVGDSAVCTIVNDDKPAHLKLVKTVTNDNGGTAGPADWTLTADGTGSNDHSGAGGFDRDVNADTYALSESAGPAGYTAGSFDCGSGAVTSVSLAPGESRTCTINNNDKPARLTLVKVVVNDHGGTKVVGDFPLFISGSPAVSGTGYSLNAGTYTASETSAYGYTASAWSGACAANGSVTLNVGDDKTCTITNDDQPGKIVVIKNAKPASGSFAFTTTGTGYNAFTLTGATTANGNRNEQMLSAGTYAVTESTQLGWVLTGIGGSPDPLTPYNCVITGSGGSTGVGDLATRSAAISLKNGDTVTCTFENTGNGATRTQGFWSTHPQLATIAWFGGSAYGHTFPGVAATSGLGDALICGRPIDSLGKVMGAFWSDIPRKSDGSRRVNLDQNRMQLLQQLIAAELNASAFGSAPAGGSAAFAAWEAALCGTNGTAINQAQQQAGAFNSGGDTSTFTPGTSADSRTARTIADRPFWDIIKP